MYRAIRLIDETLAKLLREILDRLERLERGGAVAGIVSFGTHIIVGGVDVTVVDNGGGSKSVVFTNPDNGSTFVIPL